MESAVETLGLNTSIVSFLKRSGKVPVGYMARVFHRKVSEIKKELTELERKGVVRYDRDSDKVQLAESS